MKTITIGFSTSTSFFPLYSWVIKLIYQTPYSHTYLKLYSNTTNRDIIYEAVGSGVRFVGSELWSKKSKTIKQFSLKITDDQYIEIMQYCIDHAGIKYGKLQILGIFLAKIFRLKSNPFKNKNKYQVCSETICSLLEELGYKIDKDFDLVTPKDLFKFLSHQET